jgi:hypothetical protein
MAARGEGAAADDAGGYDAGGYLELCSTTSSVRYVAAFARG